VPGADPRFWFVRGTGRGSGGRKSPGTEVPKRGPGAEPRWGSGAKPPEARRMLRHEAKKPLTERKNKPQLD